MTERRLLAILVRAPVEGKVKTRLSPPLSPETAAALYGRMAQDIVYRLGSADEWDTAVYYSPPDAGEDIKAWLQGVDRFHPQEGEDLGERQLSVFIDSARTGYARTVLIGSDCPSISADDVSQAFSLLADSDVVMGPAEDGGYYLVGAKEPAPGIFRGIEWSTGEVLEQSMMRLREEKLSFVLTDMKADIDRYEDLAAFHRSLGGDRTSCSWYDILEKAIAEGSDE
jgi:rSAM/selenodomain-associated transferase 1